MKSVFTRAHPDVKKDIFTWLAATLVSAFALAASLATTWSTQRVHSRSLRDQIIALSSDHEELKEKVHMFESFKDANERLAQQLNEWHSHHNVLPTQTMPKILACVCVNITQETWIQRVRVAVPALQSQPLHERNPLFEVDGRTSKHQHVTHVAQTLSRIRRVTRVCVASIACNPEAESTHDPYTFTLRGELDNSPELIVT